jgi:hypothetical protein
LDRSVGHTASMSAPYRDDVTRLQTASMQASGARPALHELQAPHAIGNGTTTLPQRRHCPPAAVRISNMARGARVNTRRNLKPETGSMKAVRPLRIFAKGRTRYMASKLKDQRRELCTNDDSANCQPYGLASLVAAPGLGQAPADQVTDRQQRDQEPALVGAEPLTVIVDVNHPGGDQDTED